MAVAQPSLALLLLVAKLAVAADVDEEMLFAVHEHAKLAAAVTAVGVIARSAARPLPREVVLLLLVELVLIAALGSKAQGAKRTGSEQVWRDNLINVALC